MYICSLGSVGISGMLFVKQASISTTAIFGFISLKKSNPAIMGVDPNITVIKPSA